MCSPLAFVVTSVIDRDKHVTAQADSSLSNRRGSLSRSLTTDVSVGSPMSHHKGLVWANGWHSGCWGSRIHAWLVTVNCWFMPAAGPRASLMKPVACIVTYYWLNISETVTLTAVWSKAIIVYAAKMPICKFSQEILNDQGVKRT